MRVKKKIVLSIMLCIVLAIGVTWGGVWESPPQVSIQPPQKSKRSIQPPLKFIDVKQYGALGNGIADDTAALQAAIDDAARGKANGNIVIPDGIYMINSLKSLRMKSNTNLYLSNKTILKAIPNNSQFYVVLTIENVMNVNVLGGTVRGERDEHIGTAGQWGTGIQISGASNVMVQNTIIEDCWGDGIYIGTEVFTGPGTWKVMNKVPSDIRLVDIDAKNNRRQGISLIAGRNVQIIRPVLYNTNGHDPEAGLDIEPNKPTDSLENISVIDAWTANNNGAGIQIFLKNLDGADTPVSINIERHYDDGSMRGLSVVGRDAIVAGQLSINKAQWRNAKKNGLKITDHDHRSYHIDINQAHVINANRSGVKGSNVDSAAIAIVHSKGNVLGRTGAIGNVTLQSPVIEDDGSPVLTAAPFHIWDRIDGFTIQNLQIYNPIVRGNLKDINSYPQLQPYIVW